MPIEGLYAFPCRIDKRPAIARGFYSASADPAIIELWRKRHLLMGAPTGAINGFDVLDIDPRHGGAAWLALQNLPETRIHATRSGGLHYFFKHRPGLQCNESVIAPGVDVRSTGGYVIMWPWAGYRILSSAPIAPWPTALIELLEAGRHTTSPLPFCASPVTIVQIDDRFVPKPLHNKIVALMRGAPGLHQRRVRGILRPLVGARVGRNRALFVAGLQFRELIGVIIDRASAEELLLMAASLNGYVAKRGEDFAKRTIKSGLDSRPRITGEARKYSDGVTGV
jgi:hypothetical protein